MSDVSNMELHRGFRVLSPAAQLTRRTSEY